MNEFEVDIVDDGDDWSIVYLGGVVYHSGHGVPDHVWMQLTLKPITEIRKWTMDMSDGYPPDQMNFTNPEVVRDFGLEQIK